MKKNLLLLLLFFTGCLLAGCQDHKPSAPQGASKLTVVTTIFPLYDFARNVAGDKAQVSLLLPPGVEPHGFEPKPADAVRVSHADIFIFTSEQMEPWAKGFLAGINAGGVSVVDSSRGVSLLKGPDDEDAPNGGDGHHHHHGGIDPHIWLDFSNAQIMVDNIAHAMALKDPADRSYFFANAKAYQEKLKEMDDRYRADLSRCSQRVFLHGGHYAFGYLAHRYGLTYESASAVNPDAEPSPVKIAHLVKRMRSLGLRYVFSEELLSPRVSELIARETGAQILNLNGAHNVGKDDLARGTSFISLMERNLDNLRTGLGCVR